MLYYSIHGLYLQEKAVDLKASFMYTVYVMGVNGIKYLKGLVYGLIFGSTSVIPGISAGTLAIFLNIYEKFFTMASFKNVKKNLQFLAAFCFGCACGIFSISNIIMFLLERFGQVMYFSFIGLILGMIPMIYVRARSEKIKIRNVFIFILSLLLMLIIAVTGSDNLTNQTLEQLGGITIPILTWLFVAGMISAVALLIPGISGAVVMLIFGAYTVFVEAVSTFNVIILAVLGAGMVAGCLAGIKIIKIMLRSYSQALYSSILGLILGSVFVIYPGFSFDVTGFLSVAFAACFAVLAYFFSKRA